MQFHMRSQLSSIRMIERAIVAIALLAVSTPALGCQCEDPAILSDADRQQHAKWIVDAGGSIAEVELVRTELGERYRTVRHFFGQRQDSYAVRDPVGPVTSCDYGVAPGRRAIMVFLPQGSSESATPTPCGGPSGGSREDYLPAGMCTQFFIQAEGNLERVRRISAHLRRIPNPSLSVTVLKGTSTH